MTLCLLVINLFLPSFFKGKKGVGVTAGYLAHAAAEPQPCLSSPDCAPPWRQGTAGQRHVVQTSDPPPVLGWTLSSAELTQSCSYRKQNIQGMGFKGVLQQRSMSSIPVVYLWLWLAAWPFLCPNMSRPGQQSGNPRSASDGSLSLLQLLQLMMI